MNKPAALFWLLLSAIGAAACASDQTEPQTAAEYESRAKQAYDEALIEFLDQNWEYAAQLLGDVRRNYAYSPYARRAELRLADIAFRQGKYPEAAAAYKAYAHDHPNDPEVPYARYRVIRSQFSTSGHSVLQPPLEERDLAAVRSAHTAIRAFSADYPNYDEQVELEFMRASVSGMLVRHELYVARFYTAKDEFRAAMYRVQYALRNYPDSGMEPEGIVLLGEIYLKMKRPQQAEAMFRHVIESYPESAFTTVAQRFLDRLRPSSAAGRTSESTERSL